MGLCISSAVQVDVKNTIETTKYKGERGYVEDVMIIYSEYSSENNSGEHNISKQSNNNFVSPCFPEP